MKSYREKSKANLTLKQSMQKSPKKLAGKKVNLDEVRKQVVRHSKAIRKRELEALLLGSHEDRCILIGLRVLAELVLTF
jgi:hypothetical protein